jgi:prolipoprotein diacylglyceryl transferase
MIALQTTWDPSSAGIDLFGKFTIHYYSLMWMLAFILGWYIMKRIYMKENLSEEKLDSLFVYTILGTMIGARLGHVIFYQIELFEQDFFSVFLPFRFNPTFEFTGFRGLASHGAAIGIITAMYLYNFRVLKKPYPVVMKRNYKMAIYLSLVVSFIAGVIIFSPLYQFSEVANYFFGGIATAILLVFIHYLVIPCLWILDRIVVAVAIGGAFIRIGNFFNSEIVGTPTDSPFGVVFKQLGEDFARHPAQLYEAFGYIAIFIVMYFIYWKTNKANISGYMLGLFFILLWSLRFVIEFFKVAQVEGREDWILGMNTGQVLSVPFIILGIYLMNRK